MQDSRGHHVSSLSLGLRLLQSKPVSLGRSSWMQPESSSSVPLTLANTSPESWHPGLWVAWGPVAFLGRVLGPRVESQNSWCFGSKCLHLHPQRGRRPDQGLANIFQRAGCSRALCWIPELSRGLAGGRAQNSVVLPGLHLL